MLHLSTPYTHKLKSQLLDNSKLKSGWGYDMQLPQKQYAHLLEYPERLTRANLQQKSWPAKNTINGLEMIEGLLKVDGVEGEFYDCYLGAGLYEFSTLIKDKTLKDLDLGGERTWVTKSSWDYPAEDFTIFPVLNPMFYGLDENGDWAQQAFIDDNLGYQNFFNFNTGNNLITTENATAVITPFPFVAYLLKQIFKFAQYKIKVNEFEENPQLIKKVLYTNNSIIRLTYSLVGGIWGAGPTRTLDKWDMTKIVPDVKISNFLIWLQNHLNICFVFDRNREVRIIDREKRMNMAASTFLLDKIVVNTTNSKFDKDKRGVEFKQEFDTNDHHFTEKYGWRKLSDDDYKNMKPSVPTYDDLPTPAEAGDVRLVDQDWYFKWQEYTVLDTNGNETEFKSWRWEAYTNRHQNMKIGEEDFEKIETGFSPTDYRGQIHVQGNAPLWMTTPEFHECKPKLLNYIGVHDEIPRGGGNGSIEHKTVGNDLYYGENPLYLTRWKNTVRFFINRVPGDFKMTLSPREFRDLDTTIPYLHPEGFAFFIDECSAAVKEGADLLECETDFYTV